MSNQAFSRGLTYVDQGQFDTSTTLLTTITTGSGSEGSWDEVINSTIADADHIVIFIYLSSGGGAVEDILIDVGIGGSTAEQILIENIPFSGRLIGTVGTSDAWSFPIQVPAGSRISVRGIADSAVNMGVGITLYKGNEKSPSFSGAKAYGVTANYGGTPVDSGGSANTKPSGWTELVLSTTEDIHGFWLHMGLLENLTVGTNTGDFIDIGIGGSGSEQTIVLNHFYYVTTTEMSHPPFFYDIFIPAGTRIAAKRQCSDTDATDRIRSIALVGLI